MILVHLIEGGDGSGNFEHSGRDGLVGGSSTQSYPTREEFENKIGELKIGDIFKIYNQARTKVGPEFDAGHLNRALGVIQKGWQMTSDGTFTSSNGWKCTKVGCNCPDATMRKIRWCKHALARAIVVRFWQEYHRG